MLKKFDTTVVNTILTQATPHQAPGNIHQNRFIYMLKKEIKAKFYLCEAF